MEEGNAFCIKTMERETNVKVISNDDFLKIGISTLCDKYKVTQRHRHISFIDVDSMSSFNELRNVIMGLDEDSSIVGVLRNGVLSRQFHNVASFHISMPLNNIASSINSASKILFRRERWISRLEDVMGLTHLSKKQLDVFNRIQKGADVYGIAKHLNMNVKTSYTHLRSLSESFNVHGIHELYFLAQIIHADSA